MRQVYQGLYPEPEDRSVSKVLMVQHEDLNLYPSPCVKDCMCVREYVCLPVLEKQRGEGPWGLLDSQASQTGELKVQ